MRGVKPPVAPRHPKNEQRLAALDRLDVLDTPSETGFDDLTELAAQICQTPIALVSLVDRERQWFKSRKGLELCETDLSRSVCAHTILGADVLMIEDTVEDERTALNPLVTDELGMRFYAGAPMIGRDGLPYGSLCVIDKVPRSLSPAQIVALQRLARQAVAMLEANITIREREDALRQTDILKAEIDHRVANSLQQVSVLLRLQERKVANPDAVDAIATARSRVEVVASFHRIVSALSDGRTVEMSSLVCRLAEDVVQTLPPHLKLDCELPELEMSAQFAVPLALILNEFVTNSAKYGFPDNREGVVRVDGELDADTVTIVFSDNGVGWQGETPDSPGTGIGMRVIEAAAENLSGTVDMSGEGGCRMVLRFPISAVTAT